MSDSGANKAVTPAQKEKPDQASLPESGREVSYAPTEQQAVTNGAGENYRRLAPEQQDALEPRVPEALNANQEPQAYPASPDLTADLEQPAGEKHLGPGRRETGRDILLRSAEFRRGREQSWRRLDDLVSRIEKTGVASLSAEEVEQLPLLYRATVSSLSVARGIVLDRNLLLYLENLSLRSYLAVYGPRSSVIRSLRDFFGGGFPRAVRQLRWHLLIVFAAMLAGAIAGYFLVLSDLNNFSMLVPEGLAGGRGPESTREDLLQGELFAPWPGFVNAFIVFANSLFQHNSLVGLSSFGLGFALGLPSILLILYNGLIIGAFIALHAAHDLTVDFIAWLSIHGVTEILAVLLCGAAGLRLAQKIIFPGELPRLESLARSGRAAASVAAGAVLLFFIAGFLEGGFRQFINNTPGRYIFAGATAIFWLLYFTRIGRRGKHDSSR